ncbi:MAG: hypothetical protein L0H94_12030 [Nitrospira sp.]|nr:hypothetical protein [Nitrospira sp.]
MSLETLDHGRMRGQGRFLLSALASSPKDLSSPIAIHGKHCVVFLAMDARPMSVDEISNIANWALAQGAVYFCVRGPDCKRVHDIIDEAVVCRNSGETDEDVIMTTWHEDEALDEALWFAVNSAFSAGAYEGTCETLVAIAVGSKEWGSQMTKILSESVS